MILKTLIACVCAHFVAGQGIIPGVKNSCFLDPEPGNCKAYFPSFYYNKAAKYCDCFVYTGCSGNENRYDTLDECRFSCNVASNQQIITNRCRNLLRGTPMLAELLNRTEFQGIDKPAVVGPATDLGTGVDVDCSIPPEMGPCRAYLPSYFYDPKNNYCDCFVYSGCGGNENRFRTLNDCRVSCDVGPDKQVVTKSCKTILHGTSQWTEFLEQLSGLPVQDSNIDQIDLRRQPPKGSSSLTPNTASDKEPSLPSTSSGTRKEPPFSSPSSGSDRDSPLRPSSPGSTNSQSRPLPTDISPQFNPGPVLPDELIPVPPRPLSPPRTAIMYIFQRVKGSRESTESRGDRD